MTPSPTLPLGPWQPRRLLLFGATVFLVCHVIVFIADGATSVTAVLRDAIANSIAAAVCATPVWLLCRRVPWRMGARWWFLPMHLGALVAFMALWYLLLGVTLGTTGVLAGRRFELALLVGPALHWEAFTAVVLYFAIMAGCYLTQAAADAQQALDLQHRTEMRSLRAQLDPHLLFNTLHSLLELVRSGDARADDAIDRFARVARYVSEGRGANRDIVSLRAEWEMTQDYLALESLRLGPRLSCRLDFGADLEHVSIPALTLQPLVENAIRHGIAPRPGAGALVLSAWTSEGRTHLLAEDDGLGAAATTHGSGTGLDLVRRRLEAQYGATLAFDAGPRQDGNGWRVHASFPAQSA
ncbi:MAG TPA: histidine kinase [Gemmatimonadaceae bacterium]|nr:histidine kinase [Gemmatimonadaceae bacterium]